MKKRREGRKYVCAEGFVGDSELAKALSAVSQSPSSLWQSLFISSRSAVDRTDSSCLNDFAFIVNEKRVPESAKSGWKDRYFV